MMVADGAGGLLEVADRRFDRGEWPISFQVPCCRGGGVVLPSAIRVQAPRVGRRGDVAATIPREQRQPDTA